MPVVERVNQELIVHWPHNTSHQPVAIYAGPAPDRIDRRAPVGRIENGKARIQAIPFQSRPYLELSPSGQAPILVAERRIPLRGATNFRDLGGYPANDGRRVRWGRVYRSGQLSELEEFDLAYLQDLEIALVCDFRSASERKEQPDRLPDATRPRVLHAEISTPGVDPTELQKRILRGDLEGLELDQFLVRGNQAFVLQFSNCYREMFAAMLEEDGLPALVHCSAGKDRAGMAAALILLAVGVPEEAVMEDYLLTNDYMRAETEQRLNRMRSASPSRINPEDLRPLMVADPAYLKAGFGAMRERSGSIDAYLKDTIGLTDERRVRLRELLLSP